MNDSLVSESVSIPLQCGIPDGMESSSVQSIKEDFFVSEQRLAMLPIRLPIVNVLEYGLTIRVVEMRSVSACYPA